MRKTLIPLALLAAPISATAQPATDLAGEISEQRLRTDVESMVGFGTRHTLSSPNDADRGIGAARRWAEGEFRETSDKCGGCLEVVTPQRMETGDRIPEPVLIENVVAIQRGKERPDEVVIVQGHIDSRVSDVMDAQSDAPGANDNASGSALVLEAARVLSQREYPTTIVYALLSGEEQGLFGGQLMADYAREQGWTVKAVLNNDIVGGSCGSDGFCDDDNVRVFSEGPRADLTEAARADQRRNGGENDSPSRNLSRWLDALAEQDASGLDVRQIWRADRMGRGGDHLPFLERGMPAIRFSVAVEDYDHQHQDLRTEGDVTYGDTADEMDFPYLAKVTRLNIRALDTLARAPMPPLPEAEAAVRTSTELSWNAQQGVRNYRVWQRRTDQAAWEPVASIELPQDLATPQEAREGTPFVESGGVPFDLKFSPEQITFKLLGVRGDDWLFGVSAVAEEGSESPVASAVPGGGFVPLESA